MTTEGNKHADTYSSHNIDTANGCIQIFQKLKYSDELAFGFDEIHWRGSNDSDYTIATIGSSEVRVRTFTKQVLETCIPVCQRINKTLTISLLTYKILPWFERHKTIFFRKSPENGKIIVYCTSPSQVDNIYDGIKVSPRETMLVTAMFYKPETAEFVFKWGESGVEFYASLMPSPEILTSSELAEIKRAINIR